MVKSTSDVLVEQIKKGEALIVCNKSIDEYIDDLEMELEEAKEGKSQHPERTDVVSVVTKDKTLCTMIGIKGLCDKFKNTKTK